MSCFELGLLSPDSMYELLKFHKWHCFFFAFMNTFKAFSTEPACFEVNYEVFSKKIFMFSDISHAECVFYMCSAMKFICHVDG